MTPAPLVLMALALAACDADSSEQPGPDSKEPCDLEALLPGLEHLALRSNTDAAAENLALQCTGDIAADPEKLARIHADLVRIYAADNQMRVGEREVDVDTFRVHDDSSALVGWGDNYPSAATLLDPETCGAQIVQAIQGSAVTATSFGTPYMVVEYPTHLNTRVLLAAFAAVGVPLESEGGIGDGSYLQRNVSPAGSDYLFNIGGGDCPAGCTSRHYFWWHVTPADVTLLGDWGYDHALDVPFGEPPPDFDEGAFLCPDE